MFLKLLGHNCVIKFFLLYLYRKNKLLLTKKLLLWLTSTQIQKVEFITVTLKM
jgi:hypothetical protein